MKLEAQEEAKKAKKSQEKAKETQAGENRDSESDEGEKEFSQSFDTIQKRYQQCLQGCNSYVPLEIGNCFHGMFSNLKLILTDKNLDALDSRYKDEFDNFVLKSKAVDILADEIMAYPLFPMFLPSSKKMSKMTTDKFVCTFLDELPTGVEAVLNPKLKPKPKSRCTRILDWLTCGLWSNENNQGYPLDEDLEDLLRDVFVIRTAKHRIFDVLAKEDITSWELFHSHLALDDIRSHREQLGGFNYRRLNDFLNSIDHRTHDENDTGAKDIYSYNYDDFKKYSRQSRDDQLKRISGTRNSDATVSEVEQHEQQQEEVLADKKKTDEETMQQPLQGDIETGTVAEEEIIFEKDQGQENQ